MPTARDSPRRPTAARGTSERRCEASVAWRHFPRHVGCVRSRGSIPCPNQTCEQNRVRKSLHPRRTPAKQGRPKHTGAASGARPPRNSRGPPPSRDVSRSRRERNSPLGQGRGQHNSRRGREGRAITFRLGLSRPLRCAAQGIRRRPTRTRPRSSLALP